MKQITRNFGIFAFLMGVLLPAPAFSQTLSPSLTSESATLEAQAKTQVLLAQTDAAVEQEAFTDWAQFVTTYQQFATAQNREQVIQIIQSLIPLANETVQSQSLLVSFWEEQGAVGLPTQPLADFVDFMIQHQSEKLETMTAWSTVLPQSVVAFQSSNDVAAVEQITREVQALNERMIMHQQKDQALPQIWQDTQVANMEAIAQQTSSQTADTLGTTADAATTPDTAPVSEEEFQAWQALQAARAEQLAVVTQMMGNFSATQSAITAERGQAAMCMVSSFPYGSAADVAGNPSAFCNAP
jgi:hypothetical protein